MKKCICRLGVYVSMAAIYLGGARRSASNHLYLSLAILENALARYEVALAYVDRVLKKSPNTTQGLLMKLHFTTALGRQNEANAVLVRLQKKLEAGELSTSEQQNLALYMRN